MVCRNKAKNKIIADELWAHPEHRLINYFIGFDGLIALLFVFPDAWRRSNLFCCSLIRRKISSFNDICVIVKYNDLVWNIF